REHLSRAAACKASASDTAGVTAGDDLLTLLSRFHHRRAPRALMVVTDRERYRRNDRDGRRRRAGRVAVTSLAKRSTAARRHATSRRPAAHFIPEETTHAPDQTPDPGPPRTRPPRRKAPGLTGLAGGPAGGVAGGLRQQAGRSGGAVGRGGAARPGHRPQRGLRGRLRGRGWLDGAEDLLRHRDRQQR